MKNRSTKFCGEIETAFIGLTWTRKTPFMRRPIRNQYLPSPRPPRRQSPPQTGPTTGCHHSSPNTPSCHALVTCGHPDRSRPRIYQDPGQTRKPTVSAVCFHSCPMDTRSSCSGVYYKKRHENLASLQRDLDSGRYEYHNNRTHHN